MPADVASLTGYVVSTASSSPTGNAPNVLMPAETLKLHARAKMPNEMPKMALTAMIPLRLPGLLAISTNW